MKRLNPFCRSFLKRRGNIQGLAFLLSNPHLSNFVRGKLYQSPLKHVCVPGLNCYSCPAATGACPIGALQAVIGSGRFRFAYYVTGVLILFGTLLGRFVCGFLCPFGWFQDLLHHIPARKFSTARFRRLRWLKYGILLLFVLLLPLLLRDPNGLSSPAFCQFICPQGILEAGIPLNLANVGIRRAIGQLFAWKIVVLTLFAGLSVFVYRPFCKWLCPLGAIYALFNRVALLNYRVDSEACIHCGRCKRACPTKAISVCLAGKPFARGNSACRNAGTHRFEGDKHVRFDNDRKPREL